VSFTPTPFRNDSPFKSGDWWNIAQFVILTLLAGYLFDYYIMKPREQAMLAYQNAQKVAEAQIASGEKELTKKPLPRNEVVAGQTRIELSNKLVDVTIPLAQPRLDDLALKTYFTTLDKKERIQLLSPSGSIHSLQAETSWLARDSKQKLPGRDDVWTKAPTNTPNTAVFTWSNGTGLTFTRTISVDDKFMFTIVDTVRNDSAEKITIWPYALVSQKGLPENLQGGIVHEGVIGYAADKMIEVKYGSWLKRTQAEPLAVSKNGWLGVTSHYFLVALVPDQKEDMIYRALASAGTDHKIDPNALDSYQLDLQGTDRELAPGSSTTSTMHVFAGAKQLRLLEQYQSNLGMPHFDLGVDFGWFYFLTKPFYHALIFINDYIGNFGWAIVIFTLLLRTAVYPLASTSFRSFAKMKIIQPKIQELQKTYAHDKKRMQEELVTLYQKEKVNPLSGCLPILIQIPVFFGMYKVISVAIEMRHAPFFGWIKDLSAPDPTSILNLFGLLPFDVHSSLHLGILPLALFILIMLQVRLSPPQPDKMMHIFFNYYYPVIICFIMSRFAAGLVLYWAFSAFLSIAQQIVIIRSVGGDNHLYENLFGKKKKTVLAPDEVIDNEPTPDDDGPASLPDHIKVKKKKK
jgi:YidC/Oxa1 family membrane protein insertase